MSKETNKTFDVVKDIQNKIINGKLKTGDKLLPLRDLATEYNTSRSVVNSAIHILSTKGYLEVNPRHFVQVNDFLYSGSLDIVKDIYQESIGQLRNKTIKEVLKIRLFAETDAIKEIINTKKPIDKLLEILKKEKFCIENETFEIEDIAKLDCEFHENLVGCSGNSVLFLLYMSFKDIEMDLVKKFYYSKALFTSVIKTHEQLTKSIIEENLDEAISIWSELLNKGELVVLKQI